MITLKRYASSGPMVLSSLDRLLACKTAHVTTNTITFDTTDAEYRSAVSSARSFCVLAISGMMARWVICTMAHPNWNNNITVPRYTMCHQYGPVLHQGQVENINGNDANTRMVPEIRYIAKRVMSRPASSFNKSIQFDSNLPKTCHFRFVPYRSARNPTNGVAIASPTWPSIMRAPASALGTNRAPCRNNSV